MAVSFMYSTNKYIQLNAVYLLKIRVLKYITWLHYAITLMLLYFAAFLQEHVFSQLSTKLCLQETCQRREIPLS